MDSAQAAFVAAEELYRHKHFASAEQRYREAAGAGHAQQAWCHNRRGLCLSQCGRGAEALARAPWPASLTTSNGRSRWWSSWIFLR